LFLTIEKLIYGGDGLARLPADASGRGKSVFVPFVLAGEAVEASIAQQKAGFVRARAGAIVATSPYRVQPACAYFDQCGGCHYQHASYHHQLEIKKEILRESLRRTAKLELDIDIAVHPSPPWNYRNRSRFQVQTKSNFAAGYFRMGSHALLAVEQCPISSPQINRGLSAVWQSGRSGKVPAGVQEVEFFANADDTQLLVEISSAEGARRAELRGWAEDFRSSLPEIQGVVVFKKSGAGHGQEKWITSGVDHLIYRAERGAYRVSAGSFFQTNRHLTDELVRIVTAGQSGNAAFDLYAGVGLFSTALAGDFRHIVSVESSQTSTGDLAYNQGPNGKVVQATTEQFLAGLGKAGSASKGIIHPHLDHEPELVVLDPPRSGLGERVARLVGTLNAPRVVYVSCDPVTLARDLVPLLAAGYRIEQMHLVDLFPQTYHLETVAHLVR
jgi:23S rRNA (uracil1939-C5)-methyltransferase